jgi:hypothetical protein
MGAQLETGVPATLDRVAPEGVEDDEIADELMSSAELAECTCPDWCARDHDRD